VTDNLNFGNPHNPEIFWQLKEAVRGLSEACEVFQTPVTGGNVSLYNQNPAGAIDPTPTVAMVGLVEKPEHITRQWFGKAGDAILVLGQPVATGDPLQGLGGSAYLQEIRQQRTGSPPRCDLAVEKELHLGLRALIYSGDIRSAHDCSEGGLAVALAECCVSRQEGRHTERLVGARVDLSEIKDCRLDGLLFGEAPARIIISVSALDAVKVLDRARRLGLEAARIGEVGGDSLSIKAHGGSWSWEVCELHDLWWNAIPKIMA